MGTTINVNEIPAYQVRKLAEATVDLMQRIFAQPGEEERFQLWLEQRRKEGKA